MPTIFSSVDGPLKDIEYSLSLPVSDLDLPAIVDPPAHQPYSIPRPVDPSPDSYPAIMLSR